MSVSLRSFNARDFKKLRIFFVMTRLAVTGTEAEILGTEY